MPTLSPHHNPARQLSSACITEPTPAAIQSISAADQRLRAQVFERLSQTALRWLGIQIEVRNGLVRLCGPLHDARLRAHAEWLAFTTDGVQAVCSDWQTAPGQSHADQSH